MNDLFNLQAKKICDIRNKESITLYVKIDNLNIQKTVTNSEFMNLTLIDDTGVINAKKWNITDDEKNLFKIGQLIYVSGVGSEYNNKTQLIIEVMRPINEFDQVDVNIFYQSAPISITSLKHNINYFIDKIKNENLRLLTKTLINKYEDKFFVFPAASKNHHAYISGLAHHVSTMLDLAKSIGNIYKDINLDLLYSGIILHDLGKVIELSDHLAPEYTKFGKLIGHINICFEEIRVTANNLKITSEEVMLLQHLVLSHHGLLEYGSPKMPMLLEAEVLHLIDLMDSRINMISNELTQTNDFDFTKKVFALDNRAFYKHNF